MIVADANLTLYLYVEGQHTQEAQAVLRRDSAWVVPPLWQSEFLNVLWQYIRQDIFTEQDALRRYKEASRTVQIEENPPADWCAACHLRWAGASGRARHTSPRFSDPGDVKEAGSEVF